MWFSRGLVWFSRGLVLFSRGLQCSLPAIEMEDVELVEGDDNLGENVK
jgi:hypothetical protein